MDPTPEPTRRNLLRPLLLLAVPIAIAAVLRIAPLVAQEAAPSQPGPSPAPTAEPPPAAEPAMPEVAPGDRISADNNVSFPVDI